VTVRGTLFGMVTTVVCGSLVLPGAAGAAGIAVTTTDDESMNNSTCSLREAITAATLNAAAHEDACTPGDSAQDDSVNLQAATYTIDGPAEENSNASGDFDLTSAGGTAGFLTIDGVLGANDVPLTVIDANEEDRIFDVQSEVGSTAAIEIQEMILREGDPSETNADGGAILIRDDDTQFELTAARVQVSDAERWGGGLANLNGGDGIDIAITQTEFLSNGADEGGGVWLDVPEDFPATVSRSAFVGNTVTGMGGGLYVNSSGPPGDDTFVQVSNTTFSGNEATLGGGAVGFDFGDNGTIYLRFTTITGNETDAAGAGGAIHADNNDQFVFLTQSIVSGNLAAGALANCSTTGNLQGAESVSDDSSCFAAAPGPNLVNVNPLLGALSYNPAGDQTTQTHGLLDASQARDFAATCGFAGGLDQRGIARPIGSGCDAGAFEAPLPVPSGGGSTDPGTTTPAAKKCKKKKKKKRSLAGAAKKKKKGCKKKKKKK
jgi:CSLREA domain-containing protein